ncbi:sodium-dependent transporter [Microbacterium esteraromaticum]|uniref:sodium-dependent transporter n=1 Tax=Microbacterium esteraromaticum TaxID=57043 RepID=UPI0019D3E1F7|nr:sodium-dependent transporter [Microbacterium esteraromaticum]MBN7793571.1 sodium-dependent transporter [Microbacterium esteraromaticum]MCA1305320.1 sodium-dependent transporter [Microbacterium esteraromaticum]WDH79311.1 sodium-dependent transporter [Microbacterium esteraromaticum]
MAHATTQAPRREAFSSRNVFILSAIGSAVGLGNIWRFPYVAYEGGGGAFLIPYLCALLTAGIPLLFFDYAIGHRFRGSAPLAFRRMHRAAEPLGWWQVLICVVIAAYYAVIIAWAAMYTWFSARLSWGAGNEENFFFTEFLQLGDVGADGLSGSFVPQVGLPLIAVWLVVIAIMALGVKRGIGRANMVLMPLLTAMFVILVVQALFLPGAADGLNAFFTPNWAALADPAVWAAAYGHIFFSLSVAFGIMVTYSSYLKRKTDLTGSGLVVGFANSGFEILAGIGVFAALGFMAQAAGTDVSNQASAGIGLAFVAFPTIVSQATGGSIIGVLFFGALVFAGITSLISVLEVVVSALQDKLGWGRVRTTLVVTIPIGLVSIALFSTTTALLVLDTADAFINAFGIMAGAFVSVIVVSWVLYKLPVLREHLNRRSSFRVGRVWMLLVGVLAPVVLGYLLVSEIIAKSAEPYGGYPVWFLWVFGWGMVIGLIVLAVLLSLLPWSSRSHAKDDPDYDEFLQVESYAPDSETGTVRLPDATQKGAGA